VIAVREERPEDRAAVRRVEEAAFGRAEEADIVDALRGSRPDSSGTRRHSASGRCGLTAGERQLRH
jgi:predicted N-acetyltransferase YhbS